MSNPLNMLNPDVLNFMERERRWSESRGGTKVRRVKIEKPGQAWLVRFLPVALGKSGLFYYRQAQHWHNKTPITCPRFVSPDFGGDEQADCPVCDLSERLNAEQHEEVSNFGFRLRANTIWTTFCLVFQIDPGRGEVQQLSMNEVLSPWEFNLYKGTFEELCDYFRRGRTQQRPMSVLDPKVGNDFWATKTSKGIRLDRQDPGPMFELDANFDKYLATVMNAIHEPKITLPNARQLEVFVRKAEAAAYGEPEPASEPGPARTSRRGELDEHEGEEGAEERRPARVSRSAASAPAQRPARRMPQIEEPADPAPEEAAPEEQPPDEDQPQGQDPDPLADEAADDQIPGAEVPARTAPAHAPARTAPTAARPAATAPARTAPARTAPPQAAAAGARRPVAAAAAGVRRPAPAAAPVQETVNEEEDPGVAEEAHDPAAPAEEPLPDGTEEAPPARPARPAPGAAASSGQSSLRSRLASRISAANQRS